MLVKVKEDIFEIDTFESYSNYMFSFKNNIIIPYINNKIFCSNHSSFNDGDKVNYSFLIFKGVLEIHYSYKYRGESFYSKQLFGGNENQSNINTEYISAMNLLEDFNGGEFEVKYKGEQYFHVNDLYEIKKREKSWVPVETPNYERNMQKDEVSSFFKKENIPNEILKLLKISDITNIKLINLIGE